MTQNYINHIALVLDASGSMRHLEKDVVKVADNQIAYLAQRSKELDQETRATIYAFEDRNKINCLFYDKDVLRMPSIKDRYRTVGQTPLIDATIKALQDLEKTPELYGEHAFLVYVLTDGQENASNAKPIDLSGRLQRLPDHWTVAAFVPDANGVHEAKKFGFPKENIAVWDASSAKGVIEAGETIRRTTEAFMVGRTTGIRGSRTLFQMDTTKLSAAAVAALDKLGPGQFRMLPVHAEIAIADFVEQTCKRPYRLGEAYYQPTKPVDVQAQKVIALYDKKAHSVYTGKNARQLLGLPDSTVRVSPAAHPNYEIFIQSTSVNRKLYPGTHVLLVS